MMFLSKHMPSSVMQAPIAHCLECLMLSDPHLYCSKDVGQDSSQHRGAAISLHDACMHK